MKDFNGEREHCPLLSPLRGGVEVGPPAGAAAADAPPPPPVAPVRPHTPSIQATGRPRRGREGEPLAAKARGGLAAFATPSRSARTCSARPRGDGGWLGGQTVGCGGGGQVQHGGAACAHSRQQGRHSHVWRGGSMRLSSPAAVARGPSPPPRLISQNDNHIQRLS